MKRASTKFALEKFALSKIESRKCDTKRLVSVKSASDRSAFSPRKPSSIALMKIPSFKCILKNFAKFSCESAHNAECASMSPNVDSSKFTFVKLEYLNSQLRNWQHSILEF